MATAFTALAGLHVDPTRLALLAQAAENDFVGTRCGVMDQLASALGERDHALLIDCRSLDCRPISMPADIAILIVHSGISRDLGDGAYNDRRARAKRWPPAWVSPPCATRRWKPSTRREAASRPQNTPPPAM